MKQYLLYILNIAIAMMSCSSGDDSMDNEEKPIPPILENITISNQLTKLGETYVEIFATIEGDNILTKGVCYSTSPNPDINDLKIVENTNDGYFHSIIKNLDRGRTYYAKCFATTTQGTVYGSEIEFTTYTDIEITTTTTNVDEFGHPATWVDLIVHGDSIISKGIYYSTDENLTIENCDSVITITDPNSLNSDLCQIRLELKQGTLYYLHGFAKNKNNKTKYGKKEQFKTLGESLLEPEIEITTLPVKDITKTTAISEGNITHKKNVDISIVGICWSQTENPTIEDYRNEIQYKSDSFELQLSNLEPNTQYYVRSYAITDIGIIYGNVQSFRSLHDGTFIIFEDSNFETFCLWNFDSNKDGQISIGEVDKITELDISRKNISTIPEIQYFTSLTTLDCSNNQLTSLDMSGCTNLQTLNCNHCNSMRSLNVSGCTSLQTLNCDHCNSMGSLNVSGCTSLQTLDCSWNSLTFLNVSGCTSLMTLNCKNCLSPLSLNASGCTSLAKFDYRRYKEDDTQFTYLNMSGCTNLRYLDFGGGHPLTYLNVSGCTNLEELNCKYNDNLTFLDASKCVSLKILECGSFKLSSLNVSECTNLITLDCSNNQLTSLNVSECPKLWRLNCSSNQLTSLNVSECPTLGILNCYSNQLTSLNVSECTKLEELDCRSNQLTSLNVDGCTNLEELDCRSNQLTSLNVRRCPNLTYLYCRDNPNLTTLYMWSSQHPNIYKDSFTQIIYK
ncbi:Internalin-J precursor [Alistipes finegoldii]|nr:Internalin-J precursor [Alistipes finegoldii]